MAGLSESIVRRVQERLPFLLLLVICVGFVVFYSYPYIEARGIFGTWDFEYVEGYTDRLFNYSLMQSAKTWGINFLDPFDRTGVVLYQQPLYWFLGFLANWLNVSAAASANIVQLLIPLGYVIALVFISRELELNELSTALVLVIALGSGPILDSVGGLYRVWGAHAIILPFSHVVFAPLTDTYSLLLGLISIIFFLRYHKAGRSSDAIFFVATSFLAGVTQLLCMLMQLSLYFLFVIFSQMSCLEKKVYKAGTLLVLVAVVLATFLPQIKLPMWSIALSALFLYGLVYLWCDDKHRSELRLVAMTSLLMLGFIGWNMVEVGLSGGRPDLYQDNVRNLALRVPQFDVIKAYYSVLSFLLFLPFLKKTQPLTWSIIFSFIVLSYNDSFGYNNHPYRYLTFFYPLLAIVVICISKGIWRQIELPAWKRGAFAIFFIAMLTPMVVAGLKESKVFSQKLFKPISADRIEVQNLLERYLDERGYQLIVYLPKHIMKVDRLSSRVGAKFLHSSFLSFKESGLVENLDRINSLEDLLGIVESQGLALDLVVWRRANTPSGFASLVVYESEHFALLDLASARAIDQASKDHKVKL